MKNESSMVSFRVESELYKDFINLCNKNNKNKSEMLRELLLIASSKSKIEEAKEPIMDEIHKTIKETLNAHLSSVRGLIVKTFHSAESANSITAQILSIITKTDVKEITDRELKRALYKLKGGDKD